MALYDVTVVTKEYRSLTVEAESPEDARDSAWGQIERVLNWKPEDYDTEIYVEGEIK